MAGARHGRRKSAFVNFCVLVLPRNPCRASGLHPRINSGIVCSKHARVGDNLGREKSEDGWEGGGEEGSRGGMSRGYGPFWRHKGFSLFSLVAFISRLHLCLTFNMSFLAPLHLLLFSSPLLNPYPLFISHPSCSLSPTSTLLPPHFPLPLFTPHPVLSVSLRLELTRICFRQPPIDSLLYTPGHSYQHYVI